MRTKKKKKKNSVFLSIWISLKEMNSIESTLTNSNMTHFSYNKNKEKLSITIALAKLLTKKGKSDTDKQTWIMSTKKGKETNRRKNRLTDWVSEWRTNKFRICKGSGSRGESPDPSLLSPWYSHLISNPNSIGVKYSLIELGDGYVDHVSVLTS